MNTARWIRRGLAPGYAHMAVVAALMLLVLPWQVHVLGAEQWSILAFCLSIHALLFGLDVALAPVLMRALATSDVAVHRRVLVAFDERVTRTAAALLLVVAGMIGLLAVIGIKGPASFTEYLLIAALFLFQIRNACATAYWQGTEQQLRASAHTITFLLGKQAIASAAIVFVAPNAQVFLLSLLVVSLVEWHFNTRFIDRRLPSANSAAPVTTAGQDRVWSFAVVSAAIGLIGSQLDRLWFAHALDAPTFGQFALMVMPLASYMSLQVPIQRSLLGRLSHAEHAPVARRQLFIAQVLLALPPLVGASMADPLLALWLGADSPVRAHADVLSLLLIVLSATLVSTVATLHLIASGAWRVLVVTQSIGLVLQAAVLATLTPALGMTAAATAGLMTPMITVLVVLARMITLSAHRNPR